MDKEKLMWNVVGIAANNAGGFAFKYVDPVVQPLVSSLGSNAKWAKTLLYDAGALAALYFTEGKGDMEHVGNLVAEIAKGLGTATVAADPTYILPNRGQPSRVITTNIPPSPPPRFGTALI